MAAAQLLAVNGRPVDLGPPEQVRALVAGITAGRIEVDQVTAWLTALPEAVRQPASSWLWPVRRSTNGKESGMFKRFTGRARNVVTLAQDEARALNHNYIGTEHILLGLFRDGDGIAGRALDAMGVSADAVRDQVVEIVGRGESTPRGHIPFTPRAKKVLELALREAKRLRHAYLGTEHLLLGILREGQGLAAEVLSRLGVDAAHLRRELMELLNHRGRSAEEIAAASRLVRIAVPADLRELERGLAQVRRQKEAAIDSVDFTVAGELRDAERQLVARKIEREREWTAGVDLDAVIAENHRLHGEVTRLRMLLRRHGIEPNGDTAQTA